MKNFLAICAALAATTGMAQTSGGVSSEIIDGAYLTGISDNGQWIVGQGDGEGYLYIRDLVNNKTYQAGGGLRDDGTGYTASLGKGISNDGTTIALVNGIPHYWTPSSNKWTPLPGKAVDGSAVVGSISADGNLIIGSIGDTGTTTDDVLMTNPCIWHLQSDGSYSEPEMLPHPSRDFTGKIPQYINLISMSEDGTVIGAVMTDWSGKYQLPYIFKKDADGNWTYENIGLPLLNPNNIEMVENPGYFDYLQPNPEDYMTDEQMNAFWVAFPAWASDPKITSLSDEEQKYAQFEFMASFMDEDKRKSFLEELDFYVAEARKWNQQNEQFIKFQQALAESGMNFMMNNIVISPDGQYAYCTAEKTIISDPTQGEAGIYNVYFPVRVELASGSATEYSADMDLVVTSVSADGSILCRQRIMDDYWPSEGYIYPQGEAEGMTIPEFIRNNGSKEAYTWMERSMYQEVIVGANEFGGLQYGDIFAVGIPYCTPDLNYLACANSTMYWTNDFYTNFNYVSFVLETGIDEESGVAEIGNVENTSIRVSEGSILINGKVAALDIFDLSGKKVAGFISPKDIVNPGLNSGLYIIRAKTPSGEFITIKAIL